MATAVSHAMRRYPISPPEGDYANYGFRTPIPGQSWTHKEEPESSLSRSMRYADPWLYGSVRAPGLVLAPALVLCSCQDYLNGTKRSSKKTHSVCKKCKGNRIPLATVESKFGTVRCYPTSPTLPTQCVVGGTVRASSKSRPSILTPDPYDLMRRSRMSVSDSSSSQFRARSVSPSKTKQDGVKNNLRSKSSNSVKFGTVGRKSILECNVNPYELMGLDQDSSVTMVNGQRIRIKPNKVVENNYEDVEVKKTILKTPMTPNKVENESDYRFKSILKKPSTTFSDTDGTSDQITSSSSSAKSGSNFYLPLPVKATTSNVITPRKKVQFLVQNDSVIYENDDEISSETDSSSSTSNLCQLRRSKSERVSQELKVITPIFNDTMALRNKIYHHGDSREIFSGDLEKLDGVDLAKLKGFDKIRPRGPPPLPPPPQHPPPEIPQKESPKNVINIVFQENDFDENEKRKLIEENKKVEEFKRIEENKRKEEIEKKKIEELKKQEEMLKKEFEKRRVEEIERKKQEEIEFQRKRDEEVIKKETKTNEIIIKKNMENLDKLINEENLINKNVTSKIEFETPPSAPPRKRSNNHKNLTIINQPISEDIPNKTIVRINSIEETPQVHKLKIKNEFQENLQNYNYLYSDNNQGKTSIMINGDDCYCTVNVSDDISHYQSSVVVKDSGIINIETPEKRSSTVYICGDFNSKLPPTKEILKDDSLKDVTSKDVSLKDVTSKDDTSKDVLLKNLEPKEIGLQINPESDSLMIENELPMLHQILNDPVEAVKRNLVPHVCGKSENSRRPRTKKIIDSNDLVANFLNDSLLSSSEHFENNHVSQLIEDSFTKLRNHDGGGFDDDKGSEHSSSTQYEIMDPGSDCYTDNSNRSSVTEEELCARSKFYELLAESAVEVSEGDDHHYESIKVNSDPIYEEIEIPPPLPTNPPPSTLLDDLQLDKEYTTRSIFEGASKYDILSYLVDAKERGIIPEDSYTYNFNNSGIVIEEDGKDNSEPYNRVSQLSTVSDSSEECSLVLPTVEDKVQRSVEVERNDSGVGSETSKSSLSKYRTKQELSVTCEDCDSPVENQTENEPLICRKCLKKRSERKEIISEIVETEEKYSRDLQIILEEFYQPMLVAGLLTSEQLSAIFLNVEELLENSQALAERLRDAVEIAIEQGDEDLLTVNIGKLILEAAPMLHAFETYCVRQGAASLLLASLEKEKELLRIFLRVSQMENTVLRRMNLNSFLMVPVQRVTKYPLLLARLYKVTSVHHETREQLKEAQHKIELHLNHMNSETKDVPSKLWRRISNNNGRRSSSEMDLVNIKLRKIAVDVLEWNHEEAKFALEGKLLFTQPTDNNWRKGRTIKLTPVNALLVTNGKISSNSSTRTDPSEDGLIFSRHSGVREAALLLVRDKNGRYSLLREPLYLDRCVIAADPAWQSYFEVQELLGKDTFIFKADDEDQTKIWYRHLQYYAQGMGAWRKRRNALANIMINGMGLRS
ncbi:uncharacterized protein [Onthophagus taurus]|uniref:uncharacterized protein n=1 Tax=Onthophagus taurus TaxID=166361 RepID=UPI0039BDC0A8